MQNTVSPTAEELHEAYEEATKHHHDCPDCDDQAVMQHGASVPDYVDLDCDSIEEYDCNCGCSFSLEITDGNKEIAKHNT